MNPDELQRLADDPEIQDAIEVLRLWQVDGAIYDKLIQPRPKVAKCKHCGLGIEVTNKSPSWVHAEGEQQRKHTCAVEPYGFHAEPVGEPCGDHPANPCNGARGIEPRPT